MLMSHILMVLSLDPESRKGPGLPLFLVYRKEVHSYLACIKHVAVDHQKTGTLQPTSAKPLRQVDSLKLKRPKLKTTHTTTVVLIQGLLCFPLLHYDLQIQLLQLILTRGKS